MPASGKIEASYFPREIGHHNNSFSHPLCGIAQAAATPAAPDFSGIT